MPPSSPRLTGKIHRSTSSLLKTPLVSSPIILKGLNSPEPPFMGDDNNSDSNASSFNIEDMKQKIKVLVAHSSDKLDKLDPDTQSIYQYVLSYVRILYGTQEYNQLYNLVQIEFSSIKNFQIGTLAAYFLGCSLNTNIDDKSCSVICAGAMPSPSMKEKCSLPVLVGMYSSSGLTLTMLNKMDSSKSSAILFINSNTFNPFTSSDINKIKSMGINTISIYLTSNDGINYKPITNGFIPVDSLLSYKSATFQLSPTSTSTVNTPSVSTSTSSNSSTVTNSITINGIAIAIIVLILLIVLVIFISVLATKWNYITIE